MSIKKVLILNAPVTENYLRIPQTLKRAAERHFPEMEVTFLDTFKYISNFFKKMGFDNNIDFVKKNPTIWGYIYDKVDLAKTVPKLSETKSMFQDFFSQKLKEVIAEIGPDIIACTNFLPAEQLNRLKGDRLAKHYCAIIPDFDTHWLWVQSKIDLFCVATNESAQRLHDRGIPSDKISVTGVPIPERYLEPNSVTEEEINAEYNLSEEKFKIFLFDNGYGIGPIEYVAEEIILAGKKKVQVIIYESDVSNRDKLNYLSENYPEEIRIQPIQKRIEDVMSICNLVITSPNGYICSEALCVGIPIISINPMPGNEERNSDYLIEKGVAFKVYDITGLVYKINMLIEDKLFCSRIKQKAKQIAKPDASKNVLQALLAL